MGSVVSGMIVAVLLAAGAAFLVPRLQEPAYEAYSSSSTRVGEPGQNLVGPTWNGEGRVRTAQQ